MLYRIKIPKCLDVIVMEDDIIVFSKELKEQLCTGSKKLYIHRMEEGENELVDRGLIYKE